MQRELVHARSHWRERVEALGFSFHTLETPYWVEGACYRFRADEIDRIEEATQELHGMCMALVDDALRAGDREAFGLDDAAWSLAEAAWQRREPALYGRMDLAYDGHGAPKLLEYNADTPTSLFEASVVQWYWLEETRAGRDQFNLIHERLLERWPQLLSENSSVHLCGCLEPEEDRITVEYLAETCAQAGFSVQLLDISDIGWQDGQFIDLQNQPITHLFKLYPWEWMMDEPFAPHLSQAKTRWIEPAWKQLLSNKSLLPALWQRHRGHPNLLAASHDPADIAGPMVMKPRFGREGEGVLFFDQPPLLASPTAIYQARAPLFTSAHGHALVGSWVIGDTAAGIGIREDDSAITGNAARFVPHCFD